MKKRVVFSTLLSAVLFGCGGGSDKEVLVGTGYYVDSPVEGLEYRCGIESGTTNRDGMFKFEVGKECKFYINSHLLKTTKVLTKEDHNKELKEDRAEIARFLLTLDLDGDPQNGITITPEIAKQVDMVALDDGELNKLAKKLKALPDYKGKVYSLNEAKNHLSGNDEKLEIQVASTTIVQGDSITFDTLYDGEVASYLWREGNKPLSTHKSFSTNSLSVGTHTIYLTVTDKNGNEKSAHITIEVKPKPSMWYVIEPLVQNGDTKLYVTSDENNLYFKVEGADINSTQIFIDSDNSRVSGYESGIWEDMGIDFIIKRDGVYHYVKDFDDRVTLAQNSGFIEKEEDGVKYIEATVDKSNITKFNALAKSLKVVLFGAVNAPEGSRGALYIDAHHMDQADIYPPIIKVESNFIIATDANYTTPTATAFDVEDNASVEVTTTDSVDTTKAGYYTVLFSAKDSAGNEAKASTVVQIVGQKSGYEVKKLGALNEEVVIDHDNGLVWANDDTNIPEGGDHSRGCLFIGEGTTKVDAKSAMKSFCSKSTYAGFTDWRVPTANELSYFMVRMVQEQKKMGLGKDHCVQLLSEDNGTIKAVWTEHKNFNNLTSALKPFAGYIDSQFAFPAGFKCVRGPENRINFSPFTVNLGKVGEAKTLTYTDSSGKKLMWVNEFNEANKACKAIHSQADLNASKDFCQKLNYADFDDWRYPTSAELSEFIKKTNQAHLFVGYEAPCGRLLARDGNETNATLKYVITRYGAEPIKKGSTKSIGDIGKLEIPLAKPIGLRCVREAQ